MSGTHDRTVHGYRDMVASPHHLASTAGIEVLARGGSAVDAALAVDAVLGVVAPEACGIGGDLFALVWEPSGAAPACLNASGPAGSGADPARLREEGHDRMPDFHPASVTIPGCVAGWHSLHERYGRVPIADVLAPAITLAEGGFAASTELAGALDALREDLQPQEASMGLYPSGGPPAVGDRVHRPGLARTLRGLVAEGLPTFYTGEPSAHVVDAVRGEIRGEDLAAYRPEWVEPLGLDVFGSTGWTVPPNSQGYLTLAAGAVFEELDPPDPDDPEWIHLQVEAYRSVAWERDELAADPSTGPIPAGLLDRDRLRRRAGAISREAAGVWPSPREVPGGTAYMCAIDADGMAVSLIQSNFMGIGSRIGAGPSGFFLHNRGAGFDLRQGHPNELKPGRRPLHTLSPTLWTDEGGRLTALLGTRGGPQQPQLMVQMASLLFRQREPVDRAQRRPRWTTGLPRPGADQVLSVEGTMPASVIAGLEARGHRVEVEDGLVGGWGPVSAILVDDRGLRSGAADPRVDTTCVLAR